jgi:cyclohexyl-isocyanide hydratase
MAQPMNIGFLLYPYVTQLDMTGPAQVLSCLEGAKLHFVWKDMQPVMTDAQFQILPTQNFESCPQLDVICIPGGPGQTALMQDAAVLGWLKTQGQQAYWLMSVCSGSLLLGAADLLHGYRAASHWNYREHLNRFGATADGARVVRDRNRLTGGGVTAGIDVALSLVALLRGEQQARDIQLLLEYAPEPPFEAGRPEQASNDAVERVKLLLQANVDIAKGHWKLLIDQPTVKPKANT